MAITMTPELRNKFKGFLPLVGRQEWNFQPQSFIDEFGKDDELKQFIPTITIRPYTNEEKLKITNYYMSKKAKNDSPIEMFNMFARDNVIGWNNLYDLGTGEEITFSKDNIDELSMTIKEAILMELSELSRS